MQAFVVRPIMTGLLALIIAGLCGVPQGRMSGAPLAAAACHAAAQMPSLATMLRGLC